MLLGVVEHVHHKKSPALLIVIEMLLGLDYLCIHLE